MFDGPVLGRAFSAPTRDLFTPKVLQSSVSPHGRAPPRRPSRAYVLPEGKALRRRSSDISYSPEFAPEQITD
jgi:hypothetical protein